MLLCWINLLLLLLSPCSSDSSLKKKKPNFFFILVDDLGWANVNFNRETPDDEIQTPNMDRLATVEGLHLMRHYVHFACSPTRSSFQSGRLPLHVQAKNPNPDRPNAGIPRNMTGIATKMQMGGYQTHFVGKWDVGMATFDHTPRGRGYNTSLIYFEHKNDFWTNQLMQSDCIESHPEIVDLWKDNQPAYGLNGTKYEEYLFAEHVYDAINGFVDTVDEEPFFMVIAHCPLQLPEDVLKRYHFDDDESDCQYQTPYIFPNGPDGADYQCRSTYHAMVDILDEIIGNITDLLKVNKLWNDTLLVLSSDNGCPLVLNESGCNNHPLRGSKYSNWEGGIRVASFVSGGYLPESRRGQKEYGMIHIADWYTTFSEMIGVDPVDHKAAEYGLPPIDGVNVWPLVSGQNGSSPRTEIIVSPYTLIQGQYKYLEHRPDYAVWTGEKFPNASSKGKEFRATRVDCDGGCLFDLINDWTEHENIADQHPDIVNKMAADLNEARKGFYSNNETGEDSCPQGIEVPCACWMAMNHWNGFFGPYQYLDAFD